MAGALAPIIKLRSGLPFTVTNGNVDANLDGNTNDRAQLVGDPHIDDPTIDQWFNTAAFVQNKVVTGVATDGNSPRNLLDGPGFRVVDLALSRDFQMPRQTQADVPRSRAPTSSTSSITVSRERPCRRARHPPRSASSARPTPCDGCRWDCG